MYSAGTNDHGQLGAKNPHSWYKQLTFTEVSGAYAGYVDVRAGDHFVMLLGKDGSMRAAGGFVTPTIGVGVVFDGGACGTV